MFGRLFSLAYFVAALLFLSACASTPATGPGSRTANSREAIKIGLQVTLSGDFAQEGQEMEKAVRLVVDAANAGGGIDGRPVELIVEDDRGDPLRAVEAAQRLTAQNVIAVIGAYDAAATEAAALVYDRAGILQIAPSALTSGLSQKGYSRFFRLAVTGNEQAIFTANLAKSVYPARDVAIIHHTAADSRDLAAWTRRYLENADIKVGLVDATYTQDVDFTEILTKAQQSKS